jgi:hypothetical protein
MSDSNAEQNSTFIIQIREPADTLQSLASFFKENGLVVNTFNLHRHQDGTAMVIANCLVPSHQLPGIISVRHAN